MSNAWSVRKHRAPKGALRLDGIATQRISDHVRQKAPSAKRCIKTELERSSLNQFCFVRKHRAP